MYDAALGRFMKTDRFSEKYVSLSPYQYGANNPVNNIDVNGDSITVLNYGYIRKQYMAILIQNDAGEWQYFSARAKNAFSSESKVCSVILTDILFLSENMISTIVTVASSTVSPLFFGLYFFRISNASSAVSHRRLISVSSIKTFSKAI